MSDMLVVQFEKDDEELDNAIKESFGEETEFVKAMSFDTGQEVVTALLPIVPMLAQFLFTYFVNKKDKGDDSKKPSKRVVISKDGEISIETETVEDIERILDSLRDT